MELAWMETRLVDDMLIERFWRSVKYEIIALHQGLSENFQFYNDKRLRVAFH